MYNMTRKELRAIQDETISRMFSSKDIKKVYELENTNGKSFYGKARVIEMMDGSSYLMSYSTIVMWGSPETNEIARLWGGYSDTTKRHVISFLHEVMNTCGINKSQWEAMECGKSYAIA